MYLARIHGTVTSTIKHPTLENRRLLIGRRLVSGNTESGDPLVLVDLVGARRGSTVLVSTDNQPLRATSANTAPARLLVVGIVDHVTEETAA
jgi:ethanolamine utilization protein EutN